MWRREGSIQEETIEVEVEHKESEGINEKNKQRLIGQAPQQLEVAFSA